MKYEDLSNVNHVVLDEADRMADMGFMPSVRRLLDQTNPKRQTFQKLLRKFKKGSLLVQSKRFSLKHKKQENLVISKYTKTQKIW